MNDALDYLWPLLEAQCPIVAAHVVAGCPAVGVRTGASFVQQGLTGHLVDRLPPGRQCVANDDDERALVSYLDALKLAQAMDRRSVRAAAAEQFATERIVDHVLAALGDNRC